MRNFLFFNHLLALALIYAAFAASIDIVASHLPPTKLIIASRQAEVDSVNTKVGVSPAKSKQRVNYIHKPGYRVRFFISEGTNQQERAKAEREAEFFHTLFPQYNVYVPFVSPRWVSEAGDFETQAQAQTLVDKMGEKNYRTDKIRIIKTSINIPVRSASQAIDLLSPYALPEMAHPFQSRPE